MSEIGYSRIAPSKDPCCYLHCAIFLVDTASIDVAAIKDAVTKKILDRYDGELLQNGILGDDIFRMHSIQGQESVSNPFSFDVELHANTEVPGGSVQIPFDELIGRPVTLGINLPSTTFDIDYDLASHRFIEAIAGKDVGEVSLFNGIIASFSMKQPGVYTMSVKPALWKLTLTNHYRFFYQKNIKQVIAEVMCEHYIDYSVDGIAGQDNLAITRVQDWLQAGESDYEFVQRLLGKAHIYYYFTHAAKTHTAVFANCATYPNVFADARLLRYAFTDATTMQQDDVIKDYNYQKTLMSSGISSVFVTEENAAQASPTSQYHIFESNKDKQLGALPFQLYRVFQYGGSLNEVNDFTRKTIDTLETAKTAFSGASTYAAMRTGHQFRVTSGDTMRAFDYPVRPTLDGQWFVLTQVQHHAQSEGSYTNQFQATEAGGLIAAFNMRETRQGSILAEVVHVDGSDALSVDPWFGAQTDFAPEQSQYEDFLAASQPVMSPNGPQGVYVKLSSDGSNAKPFWVKLAPYMQQAPEVHSIVLISRSNDDSETPEIQSTVHSNGNKTVTPTGWTTNTSIGSSCSTSYGDSKSIRYGKTSPVDLPKAIDIVRQSYQTGKFRDAAFSSGGSYSYSTADAGRGGMLSQSQSFGCTYSKHDGAESISYSTIDQVYSEQKIIDTTSYTTISDKTYSESTIGRSESVTTIQGESKSTSTIGSSVSTSTIVGDTTSTSTVNGNSTSTNTIVGINTSTTTMNIVNSLSTTAMQNALNATGSVNSVSATGLQIAASATGLSMSASLTGISFNAQLQGLSAGANIIGSQINTSIVGDQTNTSVVGSSMGCNLIGSSVSANITGASTNMNIVGASTGVNIVGSSLDTSINGSVTRLSMLGASSSISMTGSSTDISMAGEITTISMRGVSNSVDLVGTGMRFANEAAQMQAKTVGTVAEIVAAIKMVL